MRRTRDPFLDAARGVAALMVCAGHLRAAALLELASQPDQALWSKGLYLLTGLGHQAVMVFFVLSGYLVGGSVWAARSHLHWPTYLIARLSRLWTVLLPCLLLTWLADQWGQSMAPALYQGAASAVWHSGPPPGSLDASWRTALGNVFFLQTIAVPVFGSNGPLWSLANEFWYYIAFPCLLAGWWGVAACVALMACMPGALVWGFGVWLLGVGVHLLHQPGRVWPLWARALAALGLAGALGLSKWGGAHAWPEALTDTVLGLAFALCLLTSLGQTWGAAGRGWAQVWTRAWAWLSDISFSLYLVHFPVVMLLGARWFEASRMPSRPASWLVFAACLCGLVLLGRAVWWAFERHTPWVKGQMTQALGAWAVPVRKGGV